MAEMVSKTLRIERKTAKAVSNILRNENKNGEGGK